MILILLICVLPLFYTHPALSESMSVESIILQKYPGAEIMDITTFEVCEITYNVVGLDDKTRESDMSWNIWTNDYTNVIYIVIMDAMGHIVDEFEFYSKHGLTPIEYGKTTYEKVDEADHNWLRKGVYLFLNETYDYLRITRIGQDEIYFDQIGHLLLFNEEGNKYFDVSYAINGSGLPSLKWFMPVLHTVVSGYPEYYEQIPWVPTEKQ